jgi:hypothetical protein
MGSAGWLNRAGRYMSSAQRGRARRPEARPASVPARSGLVTGVTVGRSQAVGGVDHVRDLRGALSISRRWGDVAVVSARHGNP